MENKNLFYQFIVNKGKKYTTFFKIINNRIYAVMY